ncbi:MAG: EAL domain-containing protein [Hydrococcus sp. SU_1_0]|nr:EAL domain-containing protein [Hydrococcus sp. SU_1_0]
MESVVLKISIPSLRTLQRRYVVSYKAIATRIIDHSFVKDLHANSQDLAIVNAVITLGQGLNLNIVVEGVETAEIRDFLKNLGCEYIQGYLYSRPVPAAETTKLLQQHQ